MNIFHYQGQEEDHYTHILMNILNYKDQLVLPQFIAALIPQQAQHFQFDSSSIHIRKKECPQSIQPYEYIIGIAPSNTSGVQHSELEENPDSIPDAWICGQNFNLLFVFKTKGPLDEEQMAEYKRLKDKADVPVIRLTWDDVIDSLDTVQTDEEVLHFLLQSFRTLEVSFRSKRRSSGTPKEIISGIKKSDELYFLITGGKSVRPYKVEKIVDGKMELLKGDLQDVTAARKFIAQYVIKHKDSLPIEYKGKATIINDYTIVPGKAGKKNEWNQWRLGSYNKKLTK